MNAFSILGSSTFHHPIKCFIFRYSYDVFLFSSSIQHRIFSPAFKSALEYFTTISISICSQFALKLAFYATDTLRFGASIRIEERAFAYIFSPLLSVFKCDYALIPSSHIRTHTATELHLWILVLFYCFIFLSLCHFPLVKKSAYK